MINGITWLEYDPIGKLSFYDCPKCNNPCVLKWSGKTRGFFIGCSKFPECRFTASIDPKKINDLLSVLTEYLPIIINLMDLPEFLRGEPDILEKLHSLAHEAGDMFIGVTGTSSDNQYCFGLNTPPADKKN